MDKIEEDNRKESNEEAKFKKKKLLKLKRLFKKKKENSKKISKKLKKTVCKHIDKPTICKAIVNKRVTSGRLKAKATQGGIFLKGLRTDFVKRKFLNETNEARKNEDINKIIDIGRGMVEKRTQIFKRFSKSSDKNETCKTRKLSSIPNETDSSEESFLDLDRCSISPISLSVNSPDALEISEEHSSEKKYFDGKTKKHKKPDKDEMLDFLEEFKNLALIVEENAGMEILSKLPRHRVLETALQSLKDVSRRQQEKEIEKFYRKDNFHTKNHFLSAYELIAQNPGSLDLFNVSSYDDRRTSVLIKNTRPKFVGFSEYSPPKFSFLDDVILKTPNSSELMLYNKNPPVFQSGNQDISFSASNSDYLQDDAKKSSKGFSFVTPPIQFYRRNMF